MTLDLSALPPRRGRLAARPPAVPPGPPGAPGLRRLGLDPERDGLVLLPDGPGPFPLVVMLHGAGGVADGAVRLIAAAAERHGAAILAPESRDPRSWDLVRGGRCGPDVAFLDRALAATFAWLPVRAERIALAGFSDGGSYALSLGLANGDLFAAVLAFSPGFVAPPDYVGSPLVVVTHGSEDAVLPVTSCGRRVAASLDHAGYRLAYHEFAGGHVVPPDLADAALAAFLAD
ncbi:alpha/beta hydrolase [Methylobacterium oryzisoli]|uniref:alpha/beta hydrolase n=1 Tax=Methylobacterium oryzisoli TaxID=3385502 RepID=UPI0038918ED6